MLLKNAFDATARDLELPAIDPLEQLERVIGLQPFERFERLELLEPIERIRSPYFHVFAIAKISLFVKEHDSIQLQKYSSYTVRQR
jgi:hypothetical protein